MNMHEMAYDHLIIEAVELGNTVLRESHKLDELLQSAYKKASKLVAMGRVVDTVELMSEDVVNVTDMEAHNFYAKIIADGAFPNTIIDSEEGVSGGGKITLRIDPIDGSKHLHEGIPFFSSCASIGVKGEVVWAMVIDPISGDTFHADCDGAYLNGLKIEAKNDRSIEGGDGRYSFIFCEAPTSKLANKDKAQFDINCKIYVKLLEKGFRIRNAGGAPIGICYAAANRSPAYLDLSGTGKLYDVEAALYIAKMSGLRIMSLKDRTDLTEIAFDEKTDRKMITATVLVGSKEACEQIISLAANTIY